FAEDFILSGEADVVVHGEGEDTLRDLVPALLSNQKLDPIKGISFQKNGMVIKTEGRPLINDLDRLPYPDWNIFNYRKYGLLPFVTMSKPALTIEGSRGCPHNCSFCSLGYMGKKYRVRSVQSIADEFEYTCDYYGAKQIAFADAMFPLTEKHGLEFCAEIMRRKLEKKCIWVTETRVDIITQPLLKAMKEAGCRRLLFGIESGVQTVLDGVKKNQNIEKIVKTIKICKQIGVQTCGFFILGLPGEDKSATEETIKFALKLPLDLAKFNITIPYPGCAIYQEAEQKGKLLHRNWEDYTCYTPKPQQLPWVPEGREPKELINFQKKAIRSFYLRPRVIFRHLFIIRSIGLKFIIIGGWILVSEEIKNCLLILSIKTKNLLLKSKEYIKNLLSKIK
ncbi:MAG: B12-binding domain-containing radical SAM protein, partial [Candidatus Omnitrophica bacterium]|nr:B12-binding domain-containing radical SAM protein [Candidatus Omnitrophota bacterium]